MDKYKFPYTECMKCYGTGWMYELFEKHEPSITENGFQSNLGIGRKRIDCPKCNGNGWHK